MEDTEASEAANTSPRPSRITVACTRCRARKARCDGKVPKCTQCIAASSECVFPTIRRTRGPGKRKKQADSFVKEQITPPTQPPNHDHTRPAPDSSTSATSTDPPSRDRATRYSSNEFSLPTAPVLDLSQPHVGITNPIPIVADFLLPGAYDEHLKTLKTRIGEADPSRRLTPLLPQHIARRLIENTFTEVMESHPLMDHSNFVMLLEDQYAASLSGPANCPARWAIVNAVLALAIRAKMAPGSENTLSDIPDGFFQNAIAVIPDIILRVPSMLSVQAFLSMAMVAQGLPSSHVFVMLVSNASRQLELIGLRRLFAHQSPELEGSVQYKNAYIITHALERAAIQAYSNDPFLGC